MGTYDISASWSRPTRQSSTLIHRTSGVRKTTDGSRSPHNWYTKSEEKSELVEKVCVSTFQNAREAIGRRCMCRHELMSCVTDDSDFALTLSQANAINAPTVTKRSFDEEEGKAYNCNLVDDESPPRYQSGVYAPRRHTVRRFHGNVRRKGALRLALCVSAISLVWIITRDVGARLSGLNHMRSWEFWAGKMNSTDLFAASGKATTKVLEPPLPEIETPSISSSLHSESFRTNGPIWKDLQRTARWVGVALGISVDDNDDDDQLVAQEVRPFSSILVSDGADIKAADVEHKPRISEQGGDSIKRWNRSDAFEEKADVIVGLRDGSLSAEDSIGMHRVVTLAASGTGEDEEGKSREVGGRRGNIEGRHSLKPLEGGDVDFLAGGVAGGKANEVGGRGVSKEDLGATVVLHPLVTGRQIADYGEAFSRDTGKAERSYETANGPDNIRTVIPPTLLSVQGTALDVDHSLAAAEEGIQPSLLGGDFALMNGNSPSPPSEGGEGVNIAEKRGIGGVGDEVAVGRADVDGLPSWGMRDGNYIRVETNDSFFEGKGQKRETKEEHGPKEKETTAQHNGGIERDDYGRSDTTTRAEEKPRLRQAQEGRQKMEALSEETKPALVKVAAGISELMDTAAKRKRSRVAHAGDNIASRNEFNEATTKTKVARARTSVILGKEVRVEDKTTVADDFRPDTREESVEVGPGTREGGHVERGGEHWVMLGEDLVLVEPEDAGAQHGNGEDIGSDNQPVREDHIDKLEQLSSEVEGRDEGDNGQARAGLQGKPLNDKYRLTAVQARSSDALMSRHPARWQRARGDVNGDRNDPPTWFASAPHQPGKEAGANLVEEPPTRQHRSGVSGVGARDVKLGVREDVLGGDGGRGDEETTPCRLDGRVEQWEPPATADLRSAYRWKDEKKASMEKIRRFTKGGSELRDLIHSEVVHLDVLRHDLFCL